MTANPSGVTQMLTEIEAGNMTADEAVQWVRDYVWPPVSNTPTPRSYAELQQSTNLDPPVLRPGSFAEVAHAFYMHRIDQTTYGKLAQAYSDYAWSQRPDDRVQQ